MSSSDSKETMPKQHETPTQKSAMDKKNRVEVGQEGLAWFGHKDRQWEPCQVLQVNDEENTLKVRWHEDNKVTTRLSAARFRWNQYDAAFECDEWYWHFASIDRNGLTAVSATPTTTEDYLSFNTWKLLYDTMVSKIVDEGFRALVERDDNLAYHDVDHWKRIIRSFLPKSPKRFVRPPLTDAIIHDFDGWQVPPNEDKLKSGHTYFLRCVRGASEDQDRSSVADFFRQVANPRKGFRPFYNSYRRDNYESSPRNDEYQNHPSYVVFCVPVGRPVDNFLPVKILNVLQPSDLAQHFAPCPGRGPIMDFRNFPKPYTYFPYYDPSTPVVLARRGFYERNQGWYWRFVEHPTLGWYCYEWGTHNPESRHFGYFTLTVRQVQAFELDEYYQSKSWDFGSRVPEHRIFDMFYG